MTEPDTTPRNPDSLSLPASPNAELAVAESPHGESRGGEPTGSRRDASTDLLTRVLTDALEPGYRRAAAQKLAAEDLVVGRVLKDISATQFNVEPTPKLIDKSINIPAGTNWQGWQAQRSGSFGPLLALLVVGLVLGVAFSRARADAPLAAQQQAALRERVSAASTQVAATEAQLVALRGRIDALTARLADPAPVRQAAALAVATGLTAVRGPGVVVELDDGPPHLLTPGGADLARIQDRDLQSVVNGLWALGGEAISINGRRITVRTAIRSAGEAILVGYRPLSPPYLVDVIGPPTMASTFRESDAGQLLIGLSAQYGIGLRISPSSDLALPAGDDITLHSAQLVGNAIGASSSSAAASTTSASTTSASTTSVSTTSVSGTSAGAP